MEMPLTWGSNARVRASARIRVAKWSFYIPVEIANIQVALYCKFWEDSGRAQQACCMHVWPSLQTSAWMNS